MERNSNSTYSIIDSQTTYSAKEDEIDGGKKK